MNEILVGAATSRILGLLPRHVNDEISFVTSVEVFGNEFHPLVQQGLWDGRKRLYSRRTQTFPSGLLQIVLRVLQKNNIPYRVIENYPSYTPPTETRVFPILRPWQQNVVKKALVAKRGIIKAPTGSGKTYIFSALLEHINLPSAVLVHTWELISQTMTFLKKFCFDVGYVKGDNIDFSHKVTILSLQTCFSKVRKNDDSFLKELEKFQVLVHDEVHHAGAMETFKVLNYFTNCYYRWGFSATPWREDGLDLCLTASYGDTIADIRIKDLVDSGELAEPHTYFIEFKHEKGPSLGYHQLYDECIVKNERRNKVIAILASHLYKKGNNVLIAVRKIDHGEILKSMISKLCDNVIFLNGSVDDKKRYDYLHKLKSHGYRYIVIATKIYGEGVDIPTIDCFINGQANESSVLTLQLFGRALRLTDTKKKALLIDFLDTNRKYISAHAKARLNMLINEQSFNVKRIPVDRILSLYDSQNLFAAS